MVRSLSRDPPDRWGAVWLFFFMHSSAVLPAAQRLSSHKWHDKTTSVGRENRSQQWYLYNHLFLHTSNERDDLARGLLRQEPLPFHMLVQWYLIGHWGGSGHHWVCFRGRWAGFRGLVRRLKWLLKRFCGWCLETYLSIGRRFSWSFRRLWRFFHVMEVVVVRGFHLSRFNRSSGSSVGSLGGLTPTVWEILWRRARQHHQQTYQLSSFGRILFISPVEIATQRFCDKEHGKCSGGLWCNLCICLLYSIQYIPCNNATRISASVIFLIRQVRCFINAAMINILLLLWITWPPECESGEYIVTNSQQEYHPTLSIPERPGLFWLIIWFFGSTPFMFLFTVTAFILHGNRQDRQV